MLGSWFIFSATRLLAATKAQPLERFPWLGQHLPLVSILIFWFLLRVVDEAPKKCIREGKGGILPRSEPSDNKRSKRARRREVLVAT